MLGVGALGLYFTRTLYDEQQQQAAGVAPAGGAAYASVAEASADGEVQMTRVRRNSGEVGKDGELSPTAHPPALPFLSPGPGVARRLSQAELLEQPAGLTCGVPTRQGPLKMSSSCSLSMTPAGPAAGALGEDGGVADGGESIGEPRRYFDAPRLNLPRCARALTAVLSGMLLWVRRPSLPPSRARGTRRRALLRRWACGTWWTCTCCRRSSPRAATSRRPPARRPGRDAQPPTRACKFPARPPRPCAGEARPRGGGRTRPLLHALALRRHGRGGARLLAHPIGESPRHTDVGHSC
jgi:hypothetical protein